MSVPIPCPDPLEQTPRQGWDLHHLGLTHHSLSPGTGTGLACRPGCWCSQQPPPATPPPGPLKLSLHAAHPSPGLGCTDTVTEEWCPHAGLRVCLVPSTHLLMEKRAGQAASFVQISRFTFERPSGPRHPVLEDTWQWEEHKSAHGGGASVCQPGRAADHKPPTDQVPEPAGSYPSPRPGDRSVT